MSDFFNRKKYLKKYDGIKPLVKRWRQFLLEALMPGLVCILVVTVGMQINQKAIAYKVSVASFSGINPALEHFKQDDVRMDTKAEQRLLQISKSRQRVALIPDDPTQRYILGQWSDVYDWPVVTIHATLMKNGKVLAWDSATGIPNTTRATVWDPITNQHTNVNKKTEDGNLFCGGHANLPNGIVFGAGGTLNSNLDGIKATHFFDPTTNTWTLGPSMQYQRWYPSVTALASGDMLITSGRQISAPTTWATIPEILSLSRTLRTLTAANLTLPTYPWLQAAPNGQAFYAGPNNALRYLNTSGTGAWQNLGGRDGINRTYGSYAMYDIGKILVAGGAGGDAVSFPEASARVLNINNSPVQISTTGSMQYGRRQHNLTVLADGTVLVTGGLNSKTQRLVDLNAAIYAAELWNPATGKWRTLASMQIPRQYHSTALLLPDGRVLSAGGGICGDCTTANYLEMNAEIYSPPYLFKNDGSGDIALRPTIEYAPEIVAYGQNFTISTSQANSIEKVAMVRLGSVTHSTNMEQRYVPISFTPGNNSLSVTAPANANIMPPGYYMLFIINNNGVPSIAKIMEVGKSKFWVEAESGSLVAPMQNLSSSTASGGHYITIGSGNNALNQPPENGTDTYTLKVNLPGTYKIWGRTIAPTTSHNSFWVQVDSGPWYKWDNIPLSSNWAWNDVRDANVGNTEVNWKLSLGSHKLTVAYREDGTSLDRLLITSDLNYVPSGLGDN